ncbi:hypothetical protein [Caballeronia sp. INDeC2]|uniref:hypothetical protein n=1 Tax=Caballeronia sp. INDeC2 TaxID=2921747 RepID=UPI0020284309|nr:hypothetical protein [Caballeronia sp. INDeC2]
MTALTYDFMIGSPRYSMKPGALDDSTHAERTTEVEVYSRRWSFTGNLRDR